MLETLTVVFDGSIRGFLRTPDNYFIEVVAGEKFESEGLKPYGFRHYVKNPPMKDGYVAINKMIYLAYNNIAEYITARKKFEKELEENDLLSVDIRDAVNKVITTYEINSVNLSGELAAITDEDENCFFDEIIKCIEETPLEFLRDTVWRNLLMETSLRSQTIDAIVRKLHHATIAG
jgi:hypothetical protein